MTLVEFLRSRLLEDEQRARLALEVASGRWFWEVIAQQLHTCCDTVPDIDKTGQHLYRNADPARVLREVEAKRKILNEHRYGPRYHDKPGPVICYLCDDSHLSGDYTPGPCLTLRALAAIYEDQPDYRKEWRP